MANPRPDSNYYDVLHVSRDAPVEIIRGSYRTLMQQLRNHPDLGGDTDTAALINEAHAVLSNPKKRAAYDKQLELTESSEAISENQAPEHPTNTEIVRILDPRRECVFCGQTHRQDSGADSGTSCTNCSSPLSIADYRKLESSGNRAISRIDKRRPVTIYTDWAQPTGYAGSMTDISLHGLRVVLQQSLKINQRIRIVCDMLEAVAVVTHVEDESSLTNAKYAAGVSFITLRFAKSVGGFVSSRA